MTVVNFIKAKNKIVFDVTGLVLVPENQIEECFQFPLDATKTDHYVCPYCMFYNSGDEQLVDCAGCPMLAKDNACDGHFSTYRAVMFAIEPDVINIRQLTTSPDTKDKIAELVAQYNSELEV